MNITLRTPLSFSEIGRKDNQEDRIYPSAGTPDSRCFILCDGMGGHERGEVAAEIVSETLGRYIQDNAPASVNASFFNEALERAYTELDDRLASTEGSRPGTTLTCICIGDNGVLAAHIGDSRIYQVRPGVGIMFRTCDHSLVGELLRAGEITEAEARVHPKRNVITRAMQPGMKHHGHADVETITDIRPGDYFFLCCDGVLERLLDQKLIKILSTPGLSDSAKMDRIKAVCDGGTRDNYTAWLIPVDAVEGAPESSSAPVIPMKSHGEDEFATAASSPVTPQNVSARKSRKLIYMAVAAVLVVAAVVLALLSSGSGDSAEAPVSDSVVNVQESAADKTPEATAAPSTPAKKNDRRTPKTDNSRQSASENQPATQPQQNAERSNTNDANTNAAAAAAAAMGRTSKPDKKTDPQPVSEPEKQDAPRPVGPSEE